MSWADAANSQLPPPTPIPDALAAAARRYLTRRDATDLAEALGLEEER